MLAPAKINLYLHVTGRRDDGYHFLDSLVAFTPIGDELRIEPSSSFEFEIEGPMAPALAKEDSANNLVVRAARALAEATQRSLDVRLTLVKNLPIASGIGGGSSDAAAALRLLAEHWNLSPTDSHPYRIAAGLGQDVPCCLAAQTCYFAGIGDVMEPGPALPSTSVVLVNPNKALPTPAVYKARQGAFAPAARLERSPRDAVEFAEMLRLRTNSLTDAAVSLMPEIRVILNALEATPDCLLSHMSGSGATCFGLFPDRGAAREAAYRLLDQHPTWWVVPTLVPFEGFAPTC